MLHNRLSKQNTIPIEISPCAFHTLTKFKMEEDGFTLLTKYVFYRSPQLGGEDRDLYLQ